MRGRHVVGEEGGEEADRLGGRPGVRLPGRPHKQSYRLAEMALLTQQPSHSMVYSAVQCCGSGMFIPDPNFFHPGSRIQGQKGLDPHQRILVFLTQKIQRCGTGTGTVGTVTF